MERTFDAVAPIYEKLRPGYCPQLYQMIFDYSGVGSDSNVMEIGIGGGQAAPPFLQMGCRLTAVEIGENFSRLCREKFRAYPKFQMITGRFEDAELEEGAYDLIYAASAFHWIPEEVGYSKVFPYCALAAPLPGLPIIPSAAKGIQPFAKKWTGFMSGIITVIIRNRRKSLWNIRRKRRNAAPQ